MVCVATLAVSALPPLRAMMPLDRVQQISLASWATVYLVIAVLVTRYVDGVWY